MSVRQRKPSGPAALAPSAILWTATRVARSEEVQFTTPTSPKYIPAVLWNRAVTPRELGVTIVFMSHARMLARASRCFRSMSTKTLCGGASHMFVKTCS